LITSASGAALHDLLRVLGKRFPLLPVLIYPVAVQGEQAAAGLIAALDLANRRGDCDVLILARGGGSLEDLMPFNDERLARAIAASRLPVVTGIGHDVDLSIADLVADQRGATPSAAAALVVPDAAEVRQQVVLFEARLRRTLHYRLTGASQRLTALQRHLQLLHPRARLEQQLQRVDELTRRLEQSTRERIAGGAQRLERVQQRLQQGSPRGRERDGNARLARASERLAAAVADTLERRRQRLAALGVGLQARSPLSTLARGYAVVTDARNGALVRSPEQVAPGVAVSIRVEGGRFQATVTARPEDGVADASNR
jgi:exodeoxyribonuclease VII large subunit